MQVGISMMTADHAISPIALARGAEERGLDLLLLTDHSHVSSNSPGPDGVIRQTPPANSRTLDPFASLAAAAAVTSRILLGTGVCLVVQRDPIHTAKEVATVDLLSEGRFLFGVGGGWDAAEMGNHGTEYPRRWKLLRERVEAMKVLWSTELATYQGEFVNFQGLWQWPKPVQRPHPPIMVGGNGARTLQRVVRFGDEWIPGARSIGPEELATRKTVLNGLARDAGRAPIPVSLFGCPMDKALAQRYAGAGLRRLTFEMPDKPEGEVLSLLDRVAEWREHFTRQA